jgi:hypothetical protein
MAHTPVNHPLRPLYRLLGFLCGAYLVVFGVVGFITVGGDGLLGTPADRILGQGGNLLWSIVALIIGAVVILATVVGRNLDQVAYQYLGWALLVIGSYELATSRTDANFLKFTISTVVVTYLIGTILIAASMYTKVVPNGQAGASRESREAHAAA